MDLGLEQPVKVGRVSRHAKITDELLIELPRGLSLLLRNREKLLHTIKKRSAKKGNKADIEADNLQSVIEYYQLWAHGLFPKATFRDCTSMLRLYKSGRTKVYRRDLIDQKIRQLKIDKGIIVDDSLYTETNERENSNTIQDADLDWDLETQALLEEEAAMQELHEQELEAHEAESNI